MSEGRPGRGGIQHRDHRAPIRRTGYRLLWLCVAGLTACAAETPTRVFIPGASFAESLQVRTNQGDSARVFVGDPVTLHARRWSGPWLEVDRASLAPDACWWASAPVDVEQEVAANVRWIVRPTGLAEFNVDFRADFTREVRFSEPGHYTVLAESSGWCSKPYVGDSLRIVVVPR